MSDYMTQLYTTVQCWLATRLDRSERGATAVEYGMIVALIAAVIVVTVKTLGGHVDNAFNTVSSNMPQ